MVRSRYTIYIDDYPETGQHLLFNTLTQGIVVVDDEARGAIDALPAKPRNAGATSSSTPDAAEALGTLEDLGFLVADEAADAKNIERYFSDLGTGDDSVQATVLTTFACNFACPYCVEEGVKGAVHMDPETARRTAAFILEVAREKNAKSIFLTFYGGEPLMNMEAIRIVARSVRRGARKARLKYAMAMTTNGALLTPAVVDELVKLGLVGVKVTIDGDRDHHNARRPFKDGRGSYDRILANVSHAVRKIDVDVGCNFDEGNAGSFSAMLEDLRARGLAAKIHRITFKPISETPDDRNGVGPNAELDCVYSDPKTARTTVELREGATAMGLPTDAGVGVNICGITLQNAGFVVDPKGKLYKCAGFVGHEQFSVGSIQEGLRESETSADLWRRCQDCSYVPLCGDSCMFGSYVRFGDTDRLNCQKDFVEYVVRENLKVNHRQSLKG